MGKALPAETETLIAFPSLPHIMIMVVMIDDYGGHRLPYTYIIHDILLQVRVELLALHNSFLCCRCASFLPNVSVSRQICSILYPTKMSK